MKKRTLLKRLWIIGLLSGTLSSCVASINCISHIDRDNNGYCDNCHQKMPQVANTNVSKIEVTKLPDKTYYAVGETTIDATGGEITVTYKDNTPTNVISMTAEGVALSAPNMSSKGQKMVGVTYQNARTSFAIEVGDRKFTVSFHVGEGAGDVPSESVTINELATKPLDPIRDGYDFGGWFTDSSYTQSFDFSLTPITADIVLYAKWYKQYNVTYAANYTGGQNQVVKTYLGKAKDDVTPTERNGFNFSGWYADEATTIAFDFNQEITQDITIYAKWVSSTLSLHTITFSNNYGDAPTTTTSQVPDGEKVNFPSNPTRDNVVTKGHQAQDFTFTGWYTDSKCTTAFDVASPINSDMTLYAGWTGTYLFEAEHVNLTVDGTPTGIPIQGMGASGGSEGANMVDSPAPGTEGINANNGYYVTYLYKRGITLFFNINSDRDVKNATLVFRITCENVGFAISGTETNTTASGTKISTYSVFCNNDFIDYPTIEITDVTGHQSTGGRRPFSDYTLSTNLSLKQGENTLQFITDNDNPMGGTMAATAPVVDCIKIKSSSELSWDPNTGNEFGQ